MVDRETAFRGFAAVAAFATIAIECHLAFAEPTASSPSPALATVQEVIQSRTDVWGDAAISQPNGASYDFFKDLLPPLRWVNTQFRHYPIVLGAPRTAIKARLVSNGSAVNAHAEKPPMWTEQGTPVSFYIGDSAEHFGEKLARLRGPEYLEGYLPIVSIGYQATDTPIQERVFAPVTEKYSAQGTLFVKFSSSHHADKLPTIEARIESDAPL